MLMNNRPSSVVPGPSSSVSGNLSHHQQQQQQQHWSCDYRSHTLTHLARLLPDETALENVLSEAISGGSEYGQLIVISVDLFRTHWLHIEDGVTTADPAAGCHQNNHKFLAVLDVDGRPVSGFTRRDFLAWLIHRLVHHNNQQQQQQTDVITGVQITTAPLTGGLTKDLREYLTTRFAKGSVDHELQTTIRDNLYLRTVPVTTRPRRPGETDGLDYTFLSLEQFRLLEKNGSLLERGIYDGEWQNEWRSV